MYYYIVIAIIVAILIHFIKNRIQYNREIVQYVDKLPGPKAYPFIGTFHVFIGVKRNATFKTLKNVSAQYGPLYRTWARSSPEVNIMKPEYFEIIMKSSTLIKKGITYGFLFPWLGDGLLISSGAKWFQRRKMITPAFHFRILEHYMEVFLEKSKKLVDILQTNSNGEIFDIYPYITHCALDIICETAMGVSVNAMDDVTGNSYVDSLYRASELIIRRRFSPWFQSDLYYLFPEGREFQKHLNVLHGFTSKVIGDRKKFLKDNPNNKINPTFDDMLTSSKKRLSFLDLLLSANETIPDKDIREEVDTFMFEGHDTTTAGICWSLFLLGNNQDVQDKVYEELKQILGDKKCPESISDLSNLKYLECCIKEALRIYPSVPFISRKLTEDVVIDGYKIPKGVYCNLHIYKVHRDPEIYPDPMKFDPDRFLPENTAKRHPYAYVPFSAGPRNCIGQKFAMYEEKTILSAILMSYKITTIDSQSTVNELAELIMRPENGLKIRLEKRHK
nr:cytochrome P450 4C1-like [Onthophagus taurus]